MKLLIGVLNKTTFSFFIFFSSLSFEYLFRFLLVGSFDCSCVYFLCTYGRLTFFFSSSFFFFFFFNIKFITYIKKNV
jgi:hypothetical protein